MGEAPEPRVAGEAPVPGVVQEAAEQLPAIFQPPKDTPATRWARGKEARKNAPRTSHAGWEPASDRPDPVDLLEEQAAERDPDLVPIRYGRMLSSPFAFYRGAALIMASDLSSTPDSGLNAQLCGDAHLMNFGLYQSPERQLVFDINDFDETLPGPWEWDVKRLAAGFEIAGREHGLSPATRRAIVLSCVESYRETMAEMAGMRAIDVWYALLDAELVRAALSKTRGRSQVDRVLSKATGKDALRALSKLTQVVDGRARFRFIPPILVPADELLEGNERENYRHAVETALQSYRASLPADRRPLYDLYRFKDMARKIVGVGSVGTRAWVLLFLGRDENDPLILQSKQAQDSVLERFVGSSRYDNAGRRVVEGQRLMQAASDMLLGWYHVIGFDGKPHDFYVRQLWDGKGAFDMETMDQSAWAPYAHLCAWTLAKAHARTGDRIAIAGYMGRGNTFDRAIADFSDAYAEQNQRDYAALKKAVEGGRVERRHGRVYGADGGGSTGRRPCRSAPAALLGATALATLLRLGGPGGPRHRHRLVRCRDPVEGFELLFAGGRSAATPGLSARTPHERRACVTLGRCGLPAMRSKKASRQARHVALTWSSRRRALASFAGLPA